jgi:hypothetical protein
MEKFSTTGCVTAAVGEVVAATIAITTVRSMRGRLRLNIVVARRDEILLA